MPIKVWYKTPGLSKSAKASVLLKVSCLITVILLLTGITIMLEVEGFVQLISCGAIFIL